MTDEERKEYVQQASELRHSIAQKDKLIRDTNYDMCLQQRELRHVTEILEGRA